MRGKECNFGWHSGLREETQSEQIAKLFSLHRKAMLASAYRVLGHTQDAEDAVSDALCISLSKTGHRAKEEDDSTLIRLLGLVTMTALRLRSKRAAEITNSEAHLLDNLIDADDTDWHGAEVLHECKLRLMYACISSKAHDVLALKLSGAKVSEIAEEFGIPLETVKTSLKRSCAALRKVSFMERPELPHEAEYIFAIGKECIVYFAPQTNGSRLAGEQLAKMK